MSVVGDGMSGGDFENLLWIGRGENRVPNGIY